ncbi:IS3 family transposase [Desulfobotulus sp. H1]|uniref:IS3 family transposase n=1 Tax=Desulfobotulus pelophilus TaxID=2823377 RepID=A0ABT3ND03_9BACT|nr:IS3 family transposase [Desulfobotulus pelophilus]MCW7755345.1 IS3 family transposase [Desulfobotulus pelophilus]
MAHFISWLGLAPSKYYNWQNRYGKANEHNALIPRDFWLEDWEKKAIVDFYLEHPLEGYRRLTFMMLDRDVVAVSPSSVYRVLRAGNLLRRWNGKPSKKGTGFVQPLKPHEHWHIDVAYVNLCGTFYYLCSILDGCSRYIVHWELRQSMNEKDVEIILQRAREKYPNATPRIISDNGPQFIAKDFKEFVRIAGMTHVRTAPFYPQSNGKLERYHKTIKNECIRPKVALSLEEARVQIADYIRYYNAERLHSALGYVAPKDKLEGQDKQIFKERDKKLEAAREARKQKRLEEKERPVLRCPKPTPGEIYNSLTQQGTLSISS